MLKAKVKPRDAVEVSQNNGTREKENKLHHHHFVFMVCLRNRFHAAVRLISQMTSKCGKNKEVTHEPQGSVSLMFKE